MEVAEAAAGCVDAAEHLCQSPCYTGVGGTVGAWRAAVADGAAAVRGLVKENDVEKAPPQRERNRP